MSVTSSDIIAVAVTNLFMRKAKTCVILHAILLAPSRWLANDVTSNDRKLGLGILVLATLVAKKHALVKRLGAGDPGGEKKPELVMRLGAGDLGGESTRSTFDVVLRPWCRKACAQLATLVANTTT